MLDEHGEENNEPLDIDFPLLRSSLKFGRKSDTTCEVCVCYKWKNYILGVRVVRLGKLWLIADSKTIDMIHTHCIDNKRFISFFVAVAIQCYF